MAPSQIQVSRRENCWWLSLSPSLDSTMSSDPARGRVWLFRLPHTCKPVWTEAKLRSQHHSKGLCVLDFVCRWVPPRGVSRGPVVPFERTNLVDALLLRVPLYWTQESDDVHDARGKASPYVFPLLRLLSIASRPRAVMPCCDALQVNER